MRKHVIMTLLDTEQSYVESLRTLMQVRGVWMRCGGARGGAGGHGELSQHGCPFLVPIPSLCPSLPCALPFLVAMPGMRSQTPVLYQHRNGEEMGGSVGDGNKSTP